MRILHFLKKELLQAIRAPETILLMILFPLVLTWLLGNAFSTLGTEGVTLPDLSFPIVAEESAQLEQMRSLAEEMNIELLPMSREEALQEVRDRRSIGYIELSDGQTNFYRFDEGTRQASATEAYITEAMLFIFTKIYVQQSEVFTEAVEMQRFDLLQSPPAPSVRLTEVPGRSGPGSFDFYGVTMLTLIMMYGALQSMSMLANEFEHRTFMRLKVSTLPATQLFLVKSVGPILLTLLQAALVILVNHFAFDVNYGNALLVFGFLIPFVCFSASLGIFALILTKNSGVAVAILNVVIAVILVLGGNYMPLPKEGLMSVLAKFSPAYWLNEGIFEAIYSGGVQKGLISMGYNFALAALLFLISYVIFIREKGESFGRYH